MAKSRSKLTIKFSKDGAKTWGKKQLLADRMTDYTSLVQGALVANKDDIKDKGGVLWGSCSRPFPWRVWCANSHDWNVYFSSFPIEY